MLTYVINTSENKTFDTQMIFDVAGYNKIRWLYRPLDRIKECAQEIYERQNVLGSERFRVVVIVDFYNFDRIRLPYGRQGYESDAGVDMSLYMPYIEIFLLDNLASYLEKQNLYAADFEIYYIQNEKSGNYELFESAFTQVKQILSGAEAVSPSVSAAESWAANQNASEKGRRLRSRALVVSDENTCEALEKEIENIRGDAVLTWTTRALFWGGLRGVTINIPERWVIKDHKINTHKIVRDGLEIGLIYNGEPTKSHKVISTKEFGGNNSELSLVWEKRIIETPDEEYICRHLFKITASDAVMVERPADSSEGESDEPYIEQPKSETVCIEVNYDQLDEEAILHIINNMRIGYIEDEGFEGELLRVNDQFFKSFKLHCTPSASLYFNLNDYPYGATEMTFMQFWDAFRRRSAQRNGIRRHYYVVPFGVGTSRAALDALSLSLHLVRLYEREGTSEREGDMDVIQLDSAVLRDVLETSWGRVMVAKEKAKRNEVKYYALSENMSDKIPLEELEKRLAERNTAEAVEKAIEKERADLPPGIRDTRLSADGLFEAISDIVNRDPVRFEKKFRKQFDTTMGAYLAKRDETKEADVEKELLERKNDGVLEISPKCPSRAEYNYILEEKRKKISVLFESALSAEYIDVDYERQKNIATDAYKKYKKAEACLKKSVIADIIFMILAVAAMIVPYIILQLTSYNSKTLSSTMLGLYMTGFFAGLFVLSLIFQTLPVLSRMRKYKNILKNEYIYCCAKEAYAFSAIREKYEETLIEIERSRYDMRQLRHLYDANSRIDDIVEEHREMLDRLEECIGVILNNLDIEPVIKDVEEYEVEINFSEPVCSKKNKLYQIFSVETIETMFPKKGRD